jgi:hypothetical protein
VATRSFKSQTALVVDRLHLSGNGSSSLVVDGVASNAGFIAGELLARDLYVYIDNSANYFSADAMARIGDAIDSLNNLLAAYNVTLNTTTDATTANITLSASTTSLAGGYADGVLGCYAETGEITLIQGWSWYVGADPSGIGAGQYDFQTIVTHELGHALGLDHGDDASSVMYSTLASGIVNRTMTVADLRLHDAHEHDGPEALVAAESGRSGCGCPLCLATATNALINSRVPARVFEKVSDPAARWGKLGWITDAAIITSEDVELELSFMPTRRALALPKASFDDGLGFIGLPSPGELGDE